MVLKPPGSAQTPKNDRFSKESLTPHPLKFHTHPAYTHLGFSEEENRREMALELASGADFLCKLMSGGRPVDLRGSRCRLLA